MVPVVIDRAGVDPVLIRQIVRAAVLPRAAVQWEIACKGIAERLCPDHQRPAVFARIALVGKQRQRVPGLVVHRLRGDRFGAERR